MPGGKTGRFIHDALGWATLAFLFYFDLWKGEDVHWLYYIIPGVLMPFNLDGKERLIEIISDIFRKK